MDHVMDTAGKLSGTGSDNHLVGVAQTGKGQIHVYARAGNDLIDLDFSATISGFSHGHHARGDRDGAAKRYSDTFNFVNLAHVSDGDVVVGRIEDFDAFDQIAIEGEVLDLQNLPSNVRTVEFDGAHNDAQSNPQQWILISTDTGGHIFYALKGARVDMNMDGTANDGHQEGHFIQPYQLPDFSELQDITFVAPKNYVPIDTGSIDGKVINDYDNNPDDVRETIRGSENDDLIAAGLNGDVVKAKEGDDIIWGGTGSDTIYGGEGDDIIDGGIAAKVDFDTALAAPAAQVFRLYQGIFERDPDAAGLEFWINALESGAASLKSVISGFVNSMEYQIRFGERSTEEFVTSLYEFVLDRAADESGFNHWVTALENGAMTREAIAKSFTQSREFKSTTDDDFFAFIGSLQATNDILIGGEGQDTFVFTDRFGHDVIQDFQVFGGNNRIDLSDVTSDLPPRLGPV